MIGSVILHVALVCLCRQAVSPGPGQYRLPDVALKQGPAFTMGARPAGQQQQRTSSSKAAEIPGPGAYAAR